MRTCCLAQGMPLNILQWRMWENNLKKRSHTHTHNTKKHVAMDWPETIFQYSDKSNFRTQADSLWSLSLGFCTTLTSLGESCKWTKVYYRLKVRTKSWWGNTKVRKPQHLPLSCSYYSGLTFQNGNRRQYLRIPRWFYTFLFSQCYGWHHVCKMQSQIH